MIVMKNVFRHKYRSNTYVLNYIFTSAIKNADNNSKKKSNLKSTREGKTTAKKTDLFETTNSNKTDVGEKLKNILTEFQNSKPAKKVKVTHMQKQKVIPHKPKKTLESKTLHSVKQVAASLGGDVKQIEKDLLKSLRKFDVIKESKKDDTFGKQTNEWQEILMGIDQTFFLKPENYISNAHLISLQSTLGSQNSTGLNIFKLKHEKSEPKVELKLWEDLEKKYFNYLCSSPPDNYFEELILWTQQGKLWHFPIDNEQGLDDEAKVDFSEHVFLEEHLEPWCPKSGPLRKFMELVTVGLSKNPYLTVKDKKEHIYWYRDYFESKKKLLMELGALSKKQIGEAVNQDTTKED